MTTDRTNSRRIAELVKDGRLIDAAAKRAIRNAVREQSVGIRSTARKRPAGLDGLTIDEIFALGWPIDQAAKRAVREAVRNLEPRNLSARRPGANRPR